MAEKLSITIALEGAAEIERQLEGIGQAGTKAFADISNAAEKTGGFDKLDPKDVSAKLQKFGVTGKEAIDKITAAVAAAGRLERIVGGVRQVEAGFTSIGTAATAMSQRVTAAFTAVGTAAASTGGAIGRVGRALGILGSGALIGSVGAAVIGMEQAADAARVLEANLQAVFRNAAAGTAFFNQIQSAAQSAGASLQSTANAMLEISRAIQSGLAAKGIRFAPGEGFKRASEDARQLFETLEQGMKLSGARADDATKAISALFTELRTKGQLSGETLRKFAAQFPQLANEIVKFLGIPGETMDQLADRIDKGLAKVDTTKFINSIKRATPEIQKLRDAFDPTLGQRMDTVSGAWNRLLDSFAASPAGAAIKGILDDIARGMDEIAARKPPTTWTATLLQSLVSVGKAFNEIGKKFGEQPPVDVTQEPAWVQTYLRFIEKVKTAFGEMFKPEAAEGPPQQPAWVEAYLGFIDKVKTAFKAMFAPEAAAEGPVQQPAWVQAYLGFIEKVKIAFNSMFTPDVAAADAPEPAWVQTYLRFIERVKSAFATIFTPTVAAEGTPEPAWVQTYLRFIERIKDAINSITWETIASAGVAAWDAVTSAIGRAIAAIQRFLGFKSGGAAPAPGAAAGGQFASGGLLRGRGTGTSDSNLAWVSRGEYIVPARVVRQPGVLAFLEALRGLGRSRLKDGLPAFQGGGSVGTARTAIDQLSAGLDDLLRGFQDQTERTKRTLLFDIERLMLMIGDELKRAAEIALKGQFAGGGLLGGRGTGTSDSNLVRVSRGEYIIPAQAVRQPGVLAFLEALRRSGGSLRDVLDDMGRFALGGMVPRTIPAFAAGGLAGGGMSNVTIQFPGTPEISGLRAPARVVEELQRAATLAQVRSGGRKPSRYS